MDIGAQLKAAREAKGLSLETVSERTRVQQRYLTAIERNDLTLIPPRPFGRGFVRAYADEVGLDPEETANNYFAQFPSTRVPAEAAPRLKPEILLDSSSVLSSQWGGLATAVTILIVVVATAVALGRRGETATEARGPESAPGVPREKPVAAAAPAQSPPPVIGTSGATPAPAATPLTVALTFTRQCWVAAKADGQQVVYRLLQPGEQQTLTASKEILVRFGDAGAVTWKINGRDPGAIGLSGQVRNVKITPENAATFQ
jgi:cytoskeletal protein RodZ